MATAKTPELNAQSNAPSNNGHQDLNQAPIDSMPQSPVTYSELAFKTIGDLAVIGLNFMHKFTQVQLSLLGTFTKCVPVPVASATVRGLEELITAVTATQGYFIETYFVPRNRPAEARVDVEV
jgi:hypothetical protein